MPNGNTVVRLASLWRVLPPSEAGLSPNGLEIGRQFEHLGRA